MRSTEIQHVVDQIRSKVFQKGFLQGRFSSSVPIAARSSSGQDTALWQK